MQVSIFATMLAWMVLVGSVLAVFVGMYGVNNETKNVQTEAVAVFVGMYGVNNETKNVQ